MWQRKARIPETQRGVKAKFKLMDAKSGESSGENSGVEGY
jgi:hypothetical protein